MFGLCRKYLSILLTFDLYWLIYNVTIAYLQIFWYKKCLDINIKHNYIKMHLHCWVPSSIALHPQVRPKPNFENHCIIIVAFFLQFWNCIPPLSFSIPWVLCWIVRWPDTDLMDIIGSSLLYPQSTELYQLLLPSISRPVAKSLLFYFPD